jgi:hypothetical protein
MTVFLFQGLYADRQIRMHAAYHVAGDEKLMQLTKLLFIIKINGRQNARQGRIEPKRMIKLYAEEANCPTA